MCHRCGARPLAAGGGPKFPIKILLSESEFLTRQVLMQNAKCRMQSSECRVKAWLRADKILEKAGIGDNRRHCYRSCTGKLLHLNRFIIGFAIGGQGARARMFLRRHGKGERSEDERRSG
jgi:hypothetical protein